MALDVYGAQTAPGTPVDIAGAVEGASNQEWKLLSLGSGYQLVGNASGKVLDVYGAQTAPGTPVDIANAVAGALNQQWQIVPIDGQYCRILSTQSGRVLEVQGAQTAPGSSVDIADGVAGAPNQEWQLVQLPYYQIVSRPTGMPLDVYGAQTLSGTPVDIASAVDGARNQEWKLAPVNPAPVVLGISTVAYIDETHISTYSATDVDYDVAAYYDADVQSCLYKDGAQLGCATAMANPWTGTAGGYLNAAAQAGSYYQLITDHFLVLPQVVVSGIGYFYNPYGFGFESGSEGYDSYVYGEMGVSIYVTYQYLHLGSTGIDAYTPLTAFSRGDLHQAATTVQYNGSGVYSATLTSTGWSAGLDDGFLQISNVSTWPACPLPAFPCVIYNSTKVLVAVVATGFELWDVWYHMHHESEPSPVGWPGWDENNPTLPSGWDWEMNGEQPTGDLVKNNPDGSTEKLHPHLGQNSHGSHWDYGVKNGPGNDRAGKIYPNTDGPASGGTLVWNK